MESGTCFDLGLVNTKATISKITWTRGDDLTVFVVGVSQGCVGQQSV